MIVLGGERRRDDEECDEGEDGEWYDGLPHRDRQRRVRSDEIDQMIVFRLATAWPSERERERERERQH